MADFEITPKTLESLRCKATKDTTENNNWTEVGSYFLLAIIAEIARLTEERDALKATENRILHRELRAAQATIAALRWTEITPDNLPKMGDEIAHFAKSRFVEVAAVMDCDIPWLERRHTNFWTHRRPISPPAQARAAEVKREE
jgi:hypothetical protein